MLICALVIYFYCCKTNEEGMVGNSPKDLITADQTKTLDHAYNSRYKLISDSIERRSRGDNRSSWYGLGELRNYLIYAEKEA